MRSFLIAAMLLAGTVPAAAKRISCLQVKKLIVWTGSEAAAEAKALEHRYTQLQIDEAKRRCLGK
jgi:hypothetical protein